MHALHDWSVKAIAGDVNHAERGVGVFPDAALEESFPVHVVGRRPGSCTPVSMLCDKYRPRSHRVGPELISMILFAGMIATGGVAQADELVVDNADATVQVTGRWQANSVSPGFYGGDYLFHLRGDGASTVTWTFPATGVPGRYAVFARWSSGPNRTSEATYIVISDTDKARVRVSQRTGGGQWYGLGSYTFRPNARQGVTLLDRADGHWFAVVNAVPILRSW